MIFLDILTLVICFLSYLMLLVGAILKWLLCSQYAGYWLSLGLLMFLIGDVLSLTVNLLSNNYFQATLNFLILAGAVWLFSLGGRPKRRKTKKLIGEKSRALRDRLVKSMKPARQHLPNPA
jgi:hypothetical protein